MLPTVQMAAGWTAVIFVALLGLVILWKVAKDEIDLTFLISEENGQASMSRFQFLVFTFVIAMSFLLIAAQGDALPTVPPGVWALLGISGGSYVVSKGIQKSAGKSQEKGDKGTTSGGGGTPGTSGAAGQAGGSG